MSEELNNADNTNNTDITNNANNANNADANVDVNSNNENEASNENESSREIPIITYVSEVPKSSIPSFSEDKFVEREERERVGTLTAAGMQPYRWSISNESVRINAEDNSRADNEYENGNKREKKNGKKNKKERKNLGLKVFAVAMSALFVFSFSSMTYMFVERRNLALENNKSGISALSDNVNSDNTDVNSLLENTGIVVGDSASSEILSTEEVIAKVKPAVVCIEVTTETTLNNFFGRNSQPYTQESIGTGFILTEDGYIATNYHVVEDATKIRVTLTDGRTFEAEVIGGDEAADIAVIKVDGKNLPMVELGDSESLVQGEDVVAIGTPAGAEFAGTATKGIISAINRNVDVSSSSRYSSRTMTVIQTDASINPGNSGGPLVNNRGQVIGINTMKLSSSLFEGMGFAIPINVASPVINDIIANPGIKTDSAESSIEDTSNVSFGLSGYTVSAEESAYYNIPQGWKISEVVEGGSCWNSGMQVSDIVIALDSETVQSYEDMVTLKQKYNPGDKVVVTVYRNGDAYDFEITLAAANRQ